jgi:predicted KAP-like P-loop ATPase
VWADNETEIDLLGFDSLVDGLVIALSEPRLLPLTVGVLGDWGSGKSSLMGLACAELDADAASPTGDRYVCVRFSPWQYEDYEDVKVALMAAVLTHLADEAADDAGQREEVGRLRTFVRGFGRRSRRVVRGGVGLLPTAVPAVAGMLDPTLDPTLITLAQQGMQSATSGVAERLADPANAEDEAPVTDVAEFRSRFAALVKSLEHVAAVVVFIDDLDRCLPETVVDTFEAIRLLLGAPRTAFVVAANQKIVESAVDARYPELRGNDRAPGIGAQYLVFCLANSTTLL